MILAGDEFGRTQGGNNNAYCQDNESSWLDWRLLEANADLCRFFRLLIQFRREHWLLRREDYDLNEEDRSLHITWHGMELGKPDWSSESRALAMHLRGIEGGQTDNIYFIAHAHWEEDTFALPHLPGRRWWRVVDTRRLLHTILRSLAPKMYWSIRSDAVGPRSVVVLMESEVSIPSGAGTHKCENLRTLIADYTAAHGRRPRLWFVEDRLETLRHVTIHPDLADVGLFLAVWGYNTPEMQASVEMMSVFSGLILSSFGPALPHGSNEEIGKILSVMCRDRAHRANNLLREDER